MSSIETILASDLVETDVDLGPMTTYKLGGPAQYLAKVFNAAQLHQLIESGLTRKVDVLVVGRGSNLVVADDGYQGLVIKLGGEFGEIRFDPDIVHAGGAVPLPRLARAVVDEGHVGLEFYVGVPGSVGGAVRQNAGCFGVETSDRLLRASIVDLKSGETRVAERDSLALAYRHSNVAATDLVIEASFAISEGDVDEARQMMREITRWRKENQPGGTLNAGSVFKNPDDVSAGELIDSLGLKGVSVGGVAVSEKHANFFVANPEATSQDIMDLAELIKDRVFEKTGTKLVPEIQFVGFDYEY